MNRTIMVISYNRAIQDKTRDCLSAATRAGAAYLSQFGCPDVALARSLALSGACNALRQLNQTEYCKVCNREKSTHDEMHAFTSKNPPAEFAANRDVVLMVDDDMVWEPSDAQQLVDHARTTGVAASAMYATTLGTLAATRLDPRYTAGLLGADDPQRWVVGLGLLAIPAALLLALEADSETFKFADEKTYTEFTWCRAADGQWWSEDYTLTRRLGGVHLLPIGVGHLKTIPIYPDEETIEKIRTGERLPGERDPDVLKHVDVSASRAPATPDSRRCVSTVTKPKSQGKALLRCELMTKHENLHAALDRATRVVYRWDDALTIKESEPVP